MLNKKQETARISKALADENRIAILQQLQSGETCVCWLLKELNISQPTLSHHMRILVDAELVTCRRTGRWVHYSINEEGSRRAISILSELLSTRREEQGARCCDP